MKLKLVLGPLLIGAAFVVLIGSGMKSNTLRAVPVSQLRAADHTGQSFIGQRLRVVGFVGRAPVRKTPLQTPSGIVNVNHFGVAEKGATLAVEYRDALPDTFRAGGPVQVDGVYVSAGLIRADHVLTKCPSKYDAMTGQEKAGPSAKERATSRTKDPAGARRAALLLHRAASAGRMSRPAYQNS